MTQIEYKISDWIRLKINQNEHKIYIHNHYLNCNHFLHKKITDSYVESKNTTYAESWQQIKSYPAKRGRNDDLCFITPEKGWVINKNGKVYKTEDGGDSWKLQFEKPGSYFRTIVFADSLNGWIGTLGLNEKHLHSTDSLVLYETRDGGQNWQPTEVEGEYPTGLCGLQKVTDDMIVGCGRVRGPSYFIKTMDKGKTWKSIKLDDKAATLIVPHFFDEKNGLMIGGTIRDKENSSALVLRTKDRGETWEKVFQASQKGEYCWKIVFPTEKIGYISVQRNVDYGDFNFLKTEDSGKTWKEYVYAPKHYFIQGIGFINEDIGWIGGSFRDGTYETRDGGKTWVSTPDFGKSLNKFQFFGDTLGYVTGNRLYKIKLTKK